MHLETFRAIGTVVCRPATSSWLYESPHSSNNDRHVLFAHPPQADSAWFRQIGRNLTDPQDGFLSHSPHVLMDRDTKFSPLHEFLATSTEIEIILLPPKSPNCNAPNCASVIPLSVALVLVARTKA